MFNFFLLKKNSLNWNVFIKKHNKSNIRPRLTTMYFVLILISSPSTLQNDTTQEEDEDDTLSRTLSENSFMSAMSEHDDYGLVNLHMQVNKPITESPLLMTSYISHLSQYRCSYWDETVSILRTESMKANNNLFPKVRFLFQLYISHMYKY